MKTNFTLIYLGVTALLTAAPSDSDSINVESPPIHLSNFEVTTHPYARNQSEIAQPTQVMDLEDVGRDQAMSLGDLLSQQPGVSSTYFGPGASRPVIRALGGPRVAVLQNGTAMIDASTISPDHAVALDPLLIERVEITRGPAALLHGGSAIGGAVNVVTHRIHSSLPSAGGHGRIEGRIGSVNEERSGALVVEGATGSLAWHVDAFHRQTKDLDIPGYAESKYLRALEAAEEHHDEHEDEKAFGSLPNSFVESEGGSIGLSWIGENSYFGGAFSTLDSRYGIPPGAHAHEHENEEGEEEHHDEEELVSIDLQQRRFELRGELRNPMTGIKALRWNASFADYTHTEFEGSEVGTVFSNEGYDLRMDALHEPWGKFSGAIGVEFSASDFDAVGAEAFLPPSETQKSAVMIFEEFETRDILWQIGARLDAQSIDVKDGTNRKADGTAGAASLGWVHSIDGSWTIASSLSVTQRLPITQELFADGPHIGTGAYELGDANLESELSRSFDLSLRREAELVSGIFTVFVNDFKYFIYEDPTGAEEGGLPVNAFTQRDARFYGAEASTTVHLQEDENGHLDLTLAADFVRGANRTDDTPLPRITPLRLRTGLDWEHQNWRIGTEVVHTSAQERLTPGEIRTDAFTMWSAYAGYRFIFGNQTWDAQLRGTNLSDQEGRVHTSFLKDIAPLPGRNIVLSLRASF